MFKIYYGNDIGGGVPVRGNDMNKYRGGGKYGWGQGEHTDTTTKIF